MSLYTVSYYNERCQDAGDTIKAESLRDACEKVRDLWLGDYAYAYVYELGNEDEDMIATVFHDSIEYPEVAGRFYDISTGFGMSLTQGEVFSTLQDALDAFEELGEYAGAKSAWFTEANCGHRIPDDYRVAVVENIYDEDGDFNEDEIIAEKKYGYDEMLEEYGSRENAPFGLSRKAMQDMGW